MDKSCHDVRVAHLLDRTLILGAARRGILLPDIERHDIQYCNTNSDVLSVFQLPRLIYTGCRDGSIKCFDKRIDTAHKGQNLLGDKFVPTTSSITHLEIINDWQLLVTTVRGDFEMFDLRYAKHMDPFMRFKGHRNNYKLKLGVAVSPCQSFVFAADDDRRVRGWSTRTGQPIRPSMSIPSNLPHDPESVNFTQELALSQGYYPQFLRDPFPSDITAMQVTDGVGTRQVVDSEDAMNHDGGLCLWVASGYAIYRYWMGMEDINR